MNLEGLALTIMIAKSNNEPKKTNEIYEHSKGHHAPNCWVYLLKHESRISYSWWPGPCSKKYGKKGAGQLLKKYGIWLLGRNE